MTTYPPEIVAAMGADPTDEQGRAISMPLEPYVVVAGAGSGKTSVIAARIVYLALVALGRVPADHDGVPPGNVRGGQAAGRATVRGGDGVRQDRPGCRP